MSTLEVIDAVQRSLYNEGFLQVLYRTVRAQLRANVLRIISGGPDYKSETGPIVDLSRRESGKILKDFLQNLNLKQTLTIFEAEVGYESIREDGKDSLCDSLHLGRANAPDYSILERMVTACLASTLSTNSSKLTTTGSNNNTDSAAANNNNSAASKIDTSTVSKSNTVSDDSKQDVTNKAVDLHKLVSADKYSIKAFDDVLEMTDEDDHDDVPPQYSSHRPSVASMKDVERRTEMKPYLDDPTTEHQSTIHLKDDMNNSQSKHINDKQSSPTFNLHKREADDSDAEVDEIEEEIEEEEGPEYESDDDEEVKGQSVDNDNNSNQKLSSGTYMDDYTVSSQRSSMSTRINVRRTAERNNNNADNNSNNPSDNSKVNVFRLNQASTTRSQSGWGTLDEARYDDFAVDDDGDDLIGRKDEDVANSRMTSIPTLPARGSISANNSSHEFEGDNVKSVSNNAEVDVSLSSYTSNQEEEEEELRGPSRNSNQDDGGVRSNQTEGKGKWSSVNYDDDDEDEEVVEEEEEYAAEDFEDDFDEENLDKSQSSPEKSFGEGSKSSPDKSFEDDEIEEDISIGENSNQSSDSDFGLNDKIGNKNKNDYRAVSEGMFRARSGVLPQVSLDRGDRRSDNDNLSSSSSLKARMRQIDEQLQDYENEDTEGKLKSLRKQYERDDDNDDSVASENLNEMDFSTGGLEADERLDPNDSSGEGSFSFLDSSSKGHERK